jgi:hypothetical protein
MLDPEKQLGSITLAPYIFKERLFPWIRYRRGIRKTIPQGDSRICYSPRQTDERRYVPGTVRPHRRPAPEIKSPPAIMMADFFTSASGKMRPENQLIDARTYFTIRFGPPRSVTIRSSRNGLRRIEGASALQKRLNCCNKLEFARARSAAAAS